MNISFPSHWLLTRLKNVTTKIGSGATPRGGERAYKTVGIPLIRSMNVHFDGFHSEGLAFLDEAQAKALEGVTVRAGDVLLNITGASIGRVTQAPPEMEGARVNQHVCIIRPTKGLDPSFVAKYLASPIVQSFIAGENYGVTRQALTKEMIEDIAVPLPPVKEQQRIVSKVDSLLIRSRAIRNELGETTRLAERYKLAILDKVFQQKLELSFGAAWPLRRLNEFSDLQLGKMLDKAQNKGTPTKYLRNINVRWFGFDLSDLFEMRMTESEREKFRIRDGDILVCEGGEPGRSAVWRSGETEIKYQKAIHRVRVHPDIIPDWIVYQLYFLALSGALADKLTGTTIKHLPQEKLEEVEFLVPPESVQKKYLALLNRSFEGVHRIFSHCDLAKKLLTRLDQSVLTMAFQGKLVAVDPDDLPAELPTESDLAVDTRSHRPKQVRIRTPKRLKMSKPSFQSVKAVIEAIPNRYFSFDDLSAAFPDNYEALKESLFQLLNDSEPTIVQEFDPVAKAIRFRRCSE